MKHIQTFLNTKGYNLLVDGMIGRDTRAAAHNFILKECQRLKYALPYKGLVWVRTDQKLTNKFEDFVCLYVGGEIKAIYPATTTAGDFYVFNPLTVGGITGTAIAVPQQVIGSHQFVTATNWKSLWLGAPYFKQEKPIAIYRDGDKDRDIDTQVMTKGIFGINLHQMGLGSLVDRWSAGCNGTAKEHWLEIQKYFYNGEFVDYTLLV